MYRIVVLLTIAGLAGAPLLLTPRTAAADSQSVSVYPDFDEEFCASSRTDYWPLFVTNTSDLVPDRFDVVVTSSEGWRVALFDQNDDLIAIDENGDGTWDTDVMPWHDWNGNGYPDTNTLFPHDLWAFRVKISIPSGSEGLVDVTTLTAISDRSSATDQATMTTRVKPCATYPPGDCKYGVKSLGEAYYGPPDGGGYFEWEEWDDSGACQYGFMETAQYENSASVDGVTTTQRVAVDNVRGAEVWHIEQTSYAWGGGDRLSDSEAWAFDTITVDPGTSGLPAGTPVDMNLDAWIYYDEIDDDWVFGELQGPNGLIFYDDVRDGGDNPIWERVSVPIGTMNLGEPDQVDFFSNVLSYIDPNRLSWLSGATQDILLSVCTDVAGVEISYASGATGGCDFIEVSGEMTVVGEIDGKSTTYKVPNAEVTLSRITEAGLESIGTTATNDAGVYHLWLRQIETLPVGGKDPQFALTLRLKDRDGLVTVFDQETQPGQPACLTTASFPIQEETKATRNIMMEVYSDHADTLYWLETKDPPWLPERDWHRAAFVAEPGDSGDCDRVPEPILGSVGDPKGATNVGDINRFAHLVVIYRYTELAAVFAKQVLVPLGGFGAGLPKVNVRAFDPDEERMSYFCGQSAIRFSPLNSWYDDTGTVNYKFDGRDRPDNLEFHEYSHHIMCMSEIAGFGQMPPLATGDKNHGSLKNSTSADSWQEGFAIFMSAAISEEMLPGEKPNPSHYLFADSVVDLSGPVQGGAGPQPFYIVDRAVPGFGLVPDHVTGDEEIVIASLLWNWKYGLGLQNLWRALVDAEDPFAPQLIYFGDDDPKTAPSMGVYSAVHDWAAAHPDVYPASNVEALTEYAMLFDDSSLGLGSAGYNNFAWDVGETIGNTSWNQAYRGRPAKPGMPGSTMRLNVVGADGSPSDGATFSIDIDYVGISGGLQYEVHRQGPGPHLVDLFVPAFESIATVTASTPEASARTVANVTSGEFWEAVDPFRTGGPVDFLLEHTFILEAPEPTFVDVPESNIFYSDIEWLAAEGITRGCNPPDNTLFCPSDYVTRGQMAAFLVRALGLADDGGGDLFVDDDDSIFEGDIDRLGSAHITRGCNPPTNDRFCPDNHVTRGQMAAFLVRALRLTDDGGGDLFVDDDASVFEGDIDRLGAAGITRGCNPPTNTMFCPNSDVTREQMAAFLHRALG